MSKANTKTVVAFGEALWDCLPNGIFLGGAPFNVAYHAARLGAKATPVTAVGRDFLGDQVVERAQNGNLDTDLILRHPFLPTGVSIASLDDSGNASYEIRRPVAWDEIELSSSQARRARHADALVYGTLAARSEINRETLFRLLKKADGLKVCDVNLRTPFDDRDRAVELASQADIVKVNDEELRVLAGDAAQDESLETSLEICQKVLRVRRICVTLGSEGAAVWDDGNLSRIDPVPVEVADTIGAGDAFTAALTVSAIQGQTLKASVKRAVKLGSYVAGRSGAQPDYEPADVFRKR